MRPQRIHAWSRLLLALVGATVAWAETLPPWQPGMLDIHQVSTGRGNSALIICPDGTNIMVDAGASGTDLEHSCPPRPDGSRRPGEWIGRYVRRYLEPTGWVELDYLIVTHLHPDHLGDVGAGTPRSERGDYWLTGVTDVAEIVPVGILIDRGFPDYSYPSRPLPAGFARNYLGYVESRRQAGALCAQLCPGVAGQIALRHRPGDYPGFTIRNIAVNGVVWTGASDRAVSLVPPLWKLAQSDYPDENMCSIALRLSYGKFDWFTGGDLTCSTVDGTQPWRDVETAAARATGAVEVAVANHHGYFDAVGAESVRALRPLVWVVPAWHVTHPGIAQLERMLSERLYPGSRDVFITDLAPAAALLNQRFLPRVASVAGHVVVRVDAGGATFRVFITDNRDESDRIKAVFGPYHAK